MDSGSFAEGVVSLSNVFSRDGERSRTKWQGLWEVEESNETPRHGRGILYGLKFKLRLSSVLPVILRSGSDEGSQLWLPPGKPGAPNKS